MDKEKTITDNEYHIIAAIAYDKAVRNWQQQEDIFSELLLHFITHYESFDNKRNDERYNSYLYTVMLNTRNRILFKNEKKKWLEQVNKEQLLKEVKNDIKCQRTIPNTKDYIIEYFNGTKAKDIMVEHGISKWVFYKELDLFYIRYVKSKNKLAYI